MRKVSAALPATGAAILLVALFGARVNANSHLSLHARHESFSPQQRFDEFSTRSSADASFKRNGTNGTGLMQRTMVAMTQPQPSGSWMSTMKFMVCMLLVLMAAQRVNGHQALVVDDGHKQRVLPLLGLQRGTKLHRGASVEKEEEDFTTSAAVPSSVLGFQRSHRVRSISKGLPRQDSTEGLVVTQPETPSDLQSREKDDAIWLQRGARVRRVLFTGSEPAGPAPQSLAHEPDKMSTTSEADPRGSLLGLQRSRHLSSVPISPIEASEELAHQTNRQAAMPYKARSGLQHRRVLQKVAMHFNEEDSLNK
jgi:hypothetical protein